MLTQTQWQLVKFAIAGIAATATHAGSYALFYHQGLDVQLANALAWSLSVAVSYLGQKYWTFKQQNHSSYAGIRFIVCSLFSLLANAFFAHIFTTVYDLWLLSIAAMIFITPLATFVLMKFWVFADAK